jgi:site-specific DNA-methyltransferase (adenine-specific)
MSPNLLAYGDNLDVLKRHIASESVDLVYLDPPFNSNADYNVLFEERGERAAAQIKAFGDTWRWDTVAAKAYQEVVEAGGEIATTLRAFRTMLGTTDMLAYLSMMAPRLVELRRVLKPSGSLYLHCDPTASHYLKLLLDAIFEAKHFQNEIVWSYRTGGVSKRRWARKHDTLLFYSKDAKFKFQPLQERIYYDKPFFTNKQDADGRWFADVYMRDVWDIPAVINVSRERLGYPTQKPIALLERVIAASSQPGDVVLDPFCGCGTTIDAAQNLNRRWIGIDVTHLATGLIKHRLVSRYGPEVAASIRVLGEPTTVDDAETLADDDPYQFQAWALGLVGARTTDSIKKGGDKGIDGRLYFHEGAGSSTSQIILSVKAGHLVPAFVRDLRGVVEREAAQIGVLISFEEPTSGMRSEAASAGFYDAPNGRYPRIQLRTIGDLLAGRGIQYPPEPATVYRPTLFSPEEVPVQPRPARRHAPGPDTPTRPERPVAAPSPIAARIREGLAATSPEAPRSPRTSKRGRPVPLPLPESSDTD